MANWHEGVTHTLEIALTTDPLETPTWTDVTSYFRGPASTFRGSTSTDIEVSPGTFEFVLENGDRRFDPTNTAGPYYGNLKPMKRVRWRAEIGGVTYTVFSGFVSSWQQEWGELDGTVRLVAFEGFATISRLTLPPSAYAVEMEAANPYSYWPLQGDGVASIGDDLAIPSEWGADAFSYPLGEPLAMSWGQGEANDPHYIVDSDFMASAPAGIEAWMRVDDSAATSTVYIQALSGSTTWIRLQLFGTGALTVGYSHGANSLRTASSTTFVQFLSPGDTYHLAAFRSGSNLVVMLNGTPIVLPLIAGTHTATTDFSGGPAGIAIVGANQSGATTADSAVSHLAVYTTAPSQLQVATHYNAGVYAWSGARGDYGWETDGQRINRALDDAGWPTNMRNIVTGSVRQAAYRPDGRSVLEYIREVAASGGGFICFDVNGNLCYRDREWAWSTAYPTGGGDLEWGGDDLLWGTVPLDWGAGPLAFTDDGTGVDYIAGDPAASDIATVRNVVTVAYQRGGKTRRDATSIADYGGEYAETITARTIASAQDASNLARYHLRNRKDAQDTFPELIVSLRDGTPATQFSGVLGAVLGQVIEVTRTPMSVGSAITRYGLLLGISHEVDAVHWVSTLNLVAAPESAADAGYGIVGTSTAGASTVVPY
jgi:hypothetical protein